MARKTFFVNVRFTEDLYRKLHSSPDKKASDIVRQAVEEWLKQLTIDDKTDKVAQEGDVQKEIIITDNQEKTQSSETLVTPPKDIK